MELLVATWTLRLALVGSVAVAAVSLSAGAAVIDAIDRAVLAAFVLTFLGRQLIGWLETPEQRMLRLRARREAAIRHETKGGKEKHEPQAHKQKPVKAGRRDVRAVGVEEPAGIPA